MKKKLDIKKYELKKIGKCLLLLSDIKVKDETGYNIDRWVLHNNKIKFFKYNHLFSKSSNARTIIATTDKSLGLPLINTKDAVFYIHPEQMKGELFLINITKNEKWFKNIPPWLTYVRSGKVAYETDGKKIVKGYKPLFGGFKTQRRRIFLNIIVEQDGYYGNGYSFGDGKRYYVPFKYKPKTTKNNFIQIVNKNLE